MTMLRDRLVLPKRISRPGRLAVLLAAVALACACSKTPLPKPEVAEGRPFPPLAFENATSNALAAPELRGKMVVLNVWATWCPPCRREMPGLERLSKTLDSNRFAVVGMSTDADEQLASEFLFQNGISFTNFFDRNGRLARELGLKVYPETFLIAPDGTLVVRIPGYREWDSPEIVAELEAIYRERQPKTAGQVHAK